MNESEKLAEFEQVIFAQARRQAEEILAQANEKKDKILSQARAEAKHEEEILLENDARTIRSKAQMESAKASLEATRDVIRYRQKLVNGMFEKVKEQLEKFTKSNKYSDYIVQEANSQSELIKDKAQLVVRAEDEEIAKKSAEKINYPVEVKTDAKIKLGGFMLILPESNLMIDKTFDNSVKEQKQRFICESGLFIEE